MKKPIGLGRYLLMVRLTLPHAVRGAHRRQRTQAPEQRENVLGHHDQPGEQPKELEERCDMFIGGVMIKRFEGFRLFQREKQIWLCSVEPV